PLRCGVLAAKLGIQGRAVPLPLRIVWYPLALDDLENLRSYIAKTHPAALKSSRIAFWTRSGRWPSFQSGDASVGCRAPVSS
ncbi:MAG TPA: hypothetical protein VEQ11_07075, partial [Chloroflexota bacterium]|nr:hypothetical protein [Chloroflexota bacterium]